MEARLLTLIGPGGVGKTRLALVAASTAGSDSGHFVDLAPLGNPALLLPTVAHAFGVGEVGGRVSVAALAERLGDRAVLLVLDNCEHLLAECAGVLSAILLAAPGPRVLATSWEQPLAVAGETVWQVAPLPLPDPAGAWMYQR